MIYEELREKGLLEEARPDIRQIAALLSRARRDIATARATASIDREWALFIVHHGMMRAAKAVVMSDGWRLRGRDPHRTLALVLGEVLGEERSRLVNTFDRMRRKRQQFLDETEAPISRYEAEGAIKEAQDLLEILTGLIHERHPNLPSM